MKNVKNYAADTEARGNAGAAHEGLIAPAGTKKPQEKKLSFPRIDDGHKLMRRYSFDDNGGGYLGL